MNNDLKQELWIIFKELGVDAIPMNHYDLANVTDVKEAATWKQFLIDPEISAYIDQEAQILLTSEIRKLSSNVRDSKSVGQAQLIGALNRQTDNKQTKEGPAYIYTYVPLNASQKKADNIIELDHDIFLKDVEAPVEVEEELEIPIVEEVTVTEEVAESIIEDLTSEPEPEVIKPEIIGEPVELEEPVEIEEIKEIDEPIALEPEPVVQELVQSRPDALLEQLLRYRELNKEEFELDAIDDDEF